MAELMRAQPVEFASLAEAQLRSSVGGLHASNARHTRVAHCIVQVLLVPITEGPEP